MIILGIVLLSLFFGYLIHGELSKRETVIPHGWMTINPPKWTMALVQWNESIIAADNEGIYKINMSNGKVMEKLRQTISMNYVRDLFVDNENNLWVCHLSGVSKFDGKIWTNYSKSDGLPDNRTNCILQDENKNIWVGTDNGIGIYDGKDWRVMSSKDGLLVDSVNVMLFLKNGTMFFGSNVSPKGGISVLYKNEWNYFTTENGIPHNYITTLYEDTKGKVWAGTGFLDKGGACRFDLIDGKWAITKTLRKKDGLAGEKVCSIYEQSNGIIWFGSEYDGIAFNKSGRWQTISPGQGLAGNEVKAILYDSIGNMWLATPTGITRLTSNALKILVNGT